MINRSVPEGEIEWQWPSIGAAPSHEGLDSEIFDTEKFPHVHTFVREAIQNILDARKHVGVPVTASFEFREDDLGDKSKYLSDLVGKKGHCGLPWPKEWGKNKIRWLVVQDENTTGLQGDLKERKSDFWGYWLNFGRSNKSGQGRGGRGIGRVTFLLASQIHTVFGVTRRQGEKSAICCGMSVLKAEDWEETFRGGFAYFAESENKNVFDLYPPQIADEIAKAFATNRYPTAECTGLSLVIPYPRLELDEETICAAAIENFAPAIASGDLKVVVGARTIDATTMKTVAAEAKEKFSNISFQQDSSGIIDIIWTAQEDCDFKIDIKEEDFTGKLTEALGEDLRAKIFKKFDENELLTLLLRIPVRRNGAVIYGNLKLSIRRTPAGHTATDMFYRGGMYLPDVQAINKADLDVFLTTEDDALSVYLNFCEGKAHLGLLENTEVLEKLREQGYEGRIALKRFVNTLPRKARGLVQSDSNAPDASVFAKWFAVPRSPKSGKKKRKRKVVIIPPPERKEKYFFVTELADGFEIKANPKAEGWPLNLRVQFAYADGRIKPKWSKYDFRVRDLNRTVSGAKTSKIFESEKDSKTGLHFEECDEDFFVKVTGFDVNRELIVHHTPLRPKVGADA